uniref:Uncharacterized protein n=1 Tax=Arundo donax TaxID=35708 RepID=A0A0A9PYC5_ARUDO
MLSLTYYATCFLFQSILVISSFTFVEI